MLHRICGILDFCNVRVTFAGRGELIVRILLSSTLLLFLTQSGFSQETAEEWFNKGVSAAGSGDNETAIRCFEKTIELHPGHVASYSNIGYICGLRGMWDEAIRAYQKALEAEPNDVRTHHDLGFSFHKKGMFDAAVAEFKKALELDPAFAPAYHNLGITYAEQGMLDEAIQALSQALELGTDNPATHFSLAKAYKETGDNILAADHYYQAAMIYLQDGSREGALAAYENILPCSKEIAALLLKQLYPDKDDSTAKTALTGEKDAAWYVLTAKMNIRDGHSTDGKVIAVLDRGTQFQIVKEAPNNTPLNAWFLVKTRPGVEGWLCGLNKGGAKYKPCAGDRIVSPESNQPLTSDKSGAVGEARTDDAASATLKSVQCTVQDGETLVALDTDRTPVAYSSFSLISPSRVVLDLKGKWGYSGPMKIPVDSPLVEHVRLGRYPNKLRVVINLRKDDIAPIFKEIPGGVLVVLK